MQHEQSIAARRRRGSGSTPRRHRHRTPRSRSGLRPSLSSSCGLPDGPSGQVRHRDRVRRHQEDAGIGRIDPGARPGSVRRMSPASMSASNAGSPTVTVKPAASRVLAASLVDGRARRARSAQSETCRDTAEPRARSRRPRASGQHRLGRRRRVERLLPRTDRETRGHQLGLRVLRGLADDVRNVTGAGPADSTRVTRPPTVSDVPAAGSVRSTAPAGTLSS